MINQKDYDNKNESPEEEFEPAHSDKLVGVFIATENTFDHIAQYKSRTLDWVIPVLIFIFASVFANFLMSANTAIHYDKMDKALNRLKLHLDDMVERGELSRLLADEQITNAQQNQKEGGLSKNSGIQAASITVQILVSYFFSIVFFYFIFRVLMRRKITFGRMLVAGGLPYYINLLHIITIVLAAIFIQRYIDGFSISDIFGIDDLTTAGFLLKKLDPFKLWYFWVFAVGIKKLSGTGKAYQYAAIMLAIWIGGSFSIYMLNKLFPLSSLLL